MLWPFAVIYDGVTRVRNWMFDRGHKSIYRHSKPTIGVGNLRVGGTGKTPMIEYLINLFDSKELATLSRGYGRRTKGFILANEASTAAEIGDEPAQLKSKFPSVEVVVSESRTIGLQNISAQLPNHELVLLDDVFQHRAVKPGFMIMLTTFSKPFYKDFVLPMGRLREARKGYKRADAIVVTKCLKQLSLDQRKQTLQKINPRQNQEVFFATEAYDTLVQVSNKENQDLSFLENKTVVLITGIANAESLKNFVSTSAKISKHFDFGDHHNFTETELNEIVSYLENNNSQNTIAITTEKDLQRLRVLRNFEKFAALPTYVIPLKMKFLHDDEVRFQKLVLDYVNTNS